MLDERTAMRLLDDAAKPNGKGLLGPANCSADVKRKFYAHVLRRNIELESEKLDLERALETTRSALKVICTWAGFRDGECLTPKHTEKLCRKALKASQPNIKADA